MQAPPPRQFHPFPFRFFFNGLRYLVPPFYGWYYYLPQVGVSCTLWSGWTLTQKYQYLLQYYYAYGYEPVSVSPSQNAEILRQISLIDSECMPYPLRVY